MTDEERKAILERVADVFLLTLEVAVENFAKVVHGEKRIALVAREHHAKKGLIVHELRLTTPPPVGVKDKARSTETGKGPLREPKKGAPLGEEAFPAELDDPPWLPVGEEVEDFSILGQEAAAADIQGSSE